MNGDTPTRRADADDYLTRKGLATGQKVFGRYVLETELGAGGMGVVWRARDEELSDLVALKFLPEVVARDAAAVDELREETRHALRLTHPNIVRIRNFEREGNVAAVSMEFIDGTTLSHLRLQQPGKVFAVEKLAPLVAQLCAALDYAHRQAKVVHRDLKPANILVTKDGVVKITDFGIARSLSETSTRLTGRAGGTSGTLLYMSPQQVAGKKATPADDIYALGATLYELLTGKPPFYTGDITHQILQQAPASLAAQRAELSVDGPPIPREWEETILACLAKEPQVRLQSAREVAERLGLAPLMAGAPSPLESGVQAGLERPQREAPPPSASGRRRSRIPLLAAAIVALALGGWYYFGSFRPAQLRQAEQQRIKLEQAVAASRAQAEKEQRAQAAILARIDALVDGAAPEARQATEEAVKAYLAGAPDKDRAVVQDRWAARLAGWEAARLATTRGGLIITTTPPEAEVGVGGFAVEKSPATLKEVKLGKYPVIIRLAGYEEERREAEVKENEFTTLDVMLTRSTGALNLASMPDGLSVDVAGRAGPGAPPLAVPQTVKTPATLKLPTGDYTLTFHRAVWPDQQQSVTVARNETKPVLAEFVGGALEITSTPSGAEVFSQGKRLGITPLSFPDLAPGSFDLEFRLNGYQNATARGKVRAKETAREAVTLERILRPEEGQAWTVPDLNLEMAYVRPGTFTMGSPANEPGRVNDEGPQTRVTLTRAFWLGQTEVTQAQWEALMGSNPSTFKGASRPVEQVSWNDAMAFCRKLTERERAAGRLPKGYAYTLPTEAQWEYACRAGTTGLYAGDGNLDDMGWYEGNSGNTTHPVGQKQPNAWGLYDMHGNVWEWCLDWYGNYPGGRVTDYAGPSTGTRRVFRGGGWGRGAAFCRSAFRFKGVPSFRFFILGLRVALAPQVQPVATRYTPVISR
jgi:formylglycine-generating enzyme required for sulfatase activity